MSQPTPSTAETIDLDKDDLYLLPRLKDDEAEFLKQKPLQAESQLVYDGPGGHRNTGVFATLWELVLPTPPRFRRTEMTKQAKHQLAPEGSPAGPLQEIFAVFAKDLQRLQVATMAFFTIDTIFLFNLCDLDNLCLEYSVLGMLCLKMMIFGIVYGLLVLLAEHIKKYQDLHRTNAALARVSNLMLVEMCAPPAGPIAIADRVNHNAVNATTQTTANDAIHGVSVVPPPELVKQDLVPIVVLDDAPAAKNAASNAIANTAARAPNNVSGDDIDASSTADASGSQAPPRLRRGKEAIPLWEIPRGWDVRAPAHYRPPAPPVKTGKPSGHYFIPEAIPLWEVLRCDRDIVTSQQY